MENPFGDAFRPTGPHSNVRCYLVLISASKENLALAQRLLKNIQDRIDASAAPLWIDSKGIGVFVRSELVAHEVWKESLRDTLDADSHEAKDILIIKIGSDWAARPAAKTAQWLTRHVGDPQIVPLRKGRRR